MDFINALAWFFAIASFAILGSVFYKIGNTPNYVMNMTGVSEKVGKRILQCIFVLIVSVLWLIFG